MPSPFSTKTDAEVFVKQRELKNRWKKLVKASAFCELGLAVTLFFCPPEGLLLLCCFMPGMAEGGGL